MLQYHVKPHHLSAHVWQVELSWNQQECSNVEIYLPNWVPGSYMIRDFCKNITKIEAESDCGLLTIKQIAKNKWLINNANGHCTVRYWVYGFDLSVRGSYLDESRGYFDGASLLMSCHDWADDRCILNISLPIDKVQQGWDVATSMKRVEIEADNGVYKYEAANYAELIDHPVEIGCLKRFNFTVNEIPHEIVLTGNTGNWDANRLVEDVQRICLSQHQFFEHNSPFQSYVFLLYVGQDIYGGLEHRASTALMADRRSLPFVGMADDFADYQNLLGLFSHEYFHAWNVKSIKPAVFSPYVLEEETYTELLWFFEGVTSYYDDWFLVNSGVINEADYLNLLAKNISRVHQGSGRYCQSIAESSFNAWTKFYKQDENSSNAIVSYYQKGALAALCLDAAIRHRTKWQKSLATIMRALMNEYTENQLGIDEHAWLEKAEAICQCELKDIYQLVVHSTEELPLETALQEFGIQLHWAIEQRQQFGGLVKKVPESKDRIDFGARYQKTEAGMIIQAVFDSGLAQKAGLSAKDCIVAINGFHHSQFDDELSRTQIGDEITLHYFRQGVLQECVVTINNGKNKAAYFVIEDAQMVQQWFLS